MSESCQFQLSMSQWVYPNHNDLLGLTLLYLHLSSADHSSSVLIGSFCLCLVCRWSARLAFAVFSLHIWMKRMRRWETLFVGPLALTVFTLTQRVFQTQCDLKCCRGDGVTWCRDEPLWHGAPSQTKGFRVLWCHFHVLSKGPLGSAISPKITIRIYCHIYLWCIDVWNEPAASSDSLCINPVGFDFFVVLKR